MAYRYLLWNSVSLAFLNSLILMGIIHMISCTSASDAYKGFMIDHLKQTSSNRADRIKANEVARIGTFPTPLPKLQKSRKGETPADDRVFFPPYKFPFWGLPYGIYSKGGFFNPGLFPFVPGGPGFPPFDGVFGGPFGPGKFPGPGPTPFQGGSSANQMGRGYENGQKDGSYSYSTERPPKRYRKKKYRRKCKKYCTTTTTPAPPPPPPPPPVMESYKHDSNIYRSYRGLPSYYRPPSYGYSQYQYGYPPPPASPYGAPPMPYPIIIQAPYVMPQPQYMMPPPSYSYPPQPPPYQTPYAPNVPAPIQNFYLPPNQMGNPYFQATGNPYVASGTYPMYPPIEPQTTVTPSTTPYPTKATTTVPPAPPTTPYPVTTPPSTTYSTTTTEPGPTYRSTTTQPTTPRPPLIYYIQAAPPQYPTTSPTTPPTSTYNYSLPKNSYSYWYSTAPSSTTVSPHKSYYSGYSKSLTDTSTTTPQIPTSPFTKARASHYVADVQTRRPTYTTTASYKIPAAVKTYNDDVHHYEGNMEYETSTSQPPRTSTSSSVSVTYSKS